MDIVQAFDGRLEHRIDGVNQSLIGARSYCIRVQSAACQTGTSGENLTLPDQELLTRVLDVGSGLVPIGVFLMTSRREGEPFATGEDVLFPSAMSHAERNGAQVHADEASGEKMGAIRC